MIQDDPEVFKAMGQAMASTNAYFSGQAGDLLSADGIHGDWVNGVHKIFSYTSQVHPNSA